MTPTKTPWKSLLFSPLMICNIINAFLGGTLVVVLTVYMPTYFKDVTHVNIDEVSDKFCSICARYLSFDLFPEWNVHGTAVYLRMGIKNAVRCDS